MQTEGTAMHSQNAMQMNAVWTTLHHVGKDLLQEENWGIVCLLANRKHVSSLNKSIDCMKDNR